MRIRTLGVTTLASLLVAAACGGTAPGAGGGGGGPAGTIKIGAALPLTGADSTPGSYFKQAYELYVKQLNDAGGLDVGGKKYRIDLRIEDNKSDPATSGQLYEKLVTQDGVDLLLGGYNTTTVAQEVKVVNRLKIAYVGGGGASSSIYTDNQWAVGILASIEKLSVTELTFLKAQQDAGKLPKPMKIAIAYENSSHGKEFTTGIQDTAKANPDRFSVVFNEAFDLNGKDYTALLNKVKDANADAYMVDARVNDMITMQTQYKQLGLYHKFLTYGPRGPESAARDALKASSDYIVAATWFDYLQPGDAVKKFAETFHAAYGGKDSGSWFEASAWECSRILFTAVQKAGGVDKQKVHDVLLSTTWDGSIFPGGSIKFGKTGQADNDYVMTQNMPDSKKILIWPANLATGTPVVPYPK